MVRDHNGQKLAYVYFEEEPGRRSAAKLLTRDEARLTTSTCYHLHAVASPSHPAGATGHRVRRPEGRVRRVGASRSKPDAAASAGTAGALRVAFDRATRSFVDVGFVSDDVEVVTLAPADRGHRARAARVPFVPPALLPCNMQSAADLPTSSTWSLETASAVPAT